MYLAFDPGQTTGWAAFDVQGKITDYGHCNFEELVSFLDNYSFPVEAVIVEDFRIRSTKAKSFIGSRMETTQAIGAIRAFAQRQKAEYVLQDPGIKGVAEKLTGMKPVGAHKNSHWIDAANHGKYYLIKKGIAKTRLEIEGG